MKRRQQFRHRALGFFCIADNQQMPMANNARGIVVGCHPSSVSARSLDHPLSADLSNEPR
ncbi:unnamed protein product, partial [marine sediment metagenome]